MTQQKPPPVFLARDTYRQRRLRDVARILPVAGAILIALPLMWPESGPDRFGLADVLIYVFAVWFLLIVCAFGLSRVIRPDGDTSGGDDPSAGQD